LSLKAISGQRHSAGNVAAAVCSASASSLLGIFVSPLLVGVLMNLHGAGGSLEQVGKIMLQQYCETLEELTTEDFDATFKTNVYAPFWITRAALP
ncbi:bile acid:sodium symporter, partial [Klebsiella pneumoniae]|uniref:bile acid:sodium symporter n=1 Tax=Klebsiella pneumoniae TaxID=573 RepID=UPI00210DF8D1